MALINEIAIYGAFLWGGAALVTGIPRGFVHSELSFVFAVVAAISALVAASGWTPAAIDLWLLAAAAALYLLTPVAATVWLLRHNEPDDAGPENPKTIT